jgi:hypothetical protein
MAAIRELDGGPGHGVDVAILGRRRQRPPAATWVVFIWMASMLRSSAAADGDR